MSNSKFVNFLIDQNFYKLLIKRVNPEIGLIISKNLKKKDLNRKNIFEKELVLYIRSDYNVIGVIANQITKGSWQSFFTEKQCVELEKTVLRILVERQGLNDKVTYTKNFSTSPKPVIKQQEKIDLVEKGFVYLIRNQDIYKIGITDNLLRRFNQLKPDEVLNVVRCSNFESLEKELHKKFKEYRIPQTEYFRLSKNQIEKVNIEMINGADF